MRVLVESKHTLVVEHNGKRILAAILVLIGLHMLLMAKVLIPLFSEYSEESSGVLIGIFSLTTYMLAIYLARGPFAEKRTITFHGHKKHIIIERKIFGIQFQEEIPFDDFTAIEISPPLEKGLCQLRLADGNARVILRVKSMEDFDIMRRLDVITRRTVQEI